MPVTGRSHNADDGLETVAALALSAADGAVRERDEARIAGHALLARIEEGAADGRLPAMLNLGPLAPEHPFYDIWAAMEAVRNA